MFRHSAHPLTPASASDARSASTEGRYTPGNAQIMKAGPQPLRREFQSGYGPLAGNVPRPPATVIRVCVPSVMLVPRSVHCRMRLGVSPVGPPFLASGTTHVPAGRRREQTMRSVSNLGTRVDTSATAAVDPANAEFTRSGNISRD